MNNKQYMRRNLGFAPILIVVVIAIIALIGIVVINPFDKSGGPPAIIKRLVERQGFGHSEFSNLPECDGREYSVPIVDIDEINSITPLGNLNPPEHTIPTNHMYLHLNSSGVELRAPADIVVTSISSNENAERGTTDYSIDFALCREIHGYFIHIKTLVPELEGLLSDKNCNTYGDGKFTSCWSEIQKELKAGDLIGTVGNNQQDNFDFGAIDFRTKLAYINPSRYAPPGDPNPRTLSIVCPLDIYDEATKNFLYSKVDRTADPMCGVVAQDVSGTLQGNWFTGDDQDWNNHLSFVNDNFDPEKAVISIGGVFANSSRWSFIPKTSGTDNRKFSDIKPDGEIYCFKDEGLRDGFERNVGKILVQLTRDTELSIEYQSGDCSGSYSFTNPSIYER